MSGRWLTWDTGVTSLGGYSTSALAQLLGPPPGPRTPGRTLWGGLGILLLILGALGVLGGVAQTGSQSTSSGDPAAAVAVGSVLLFAGVLSIVQDRRRRSRELEAEQRFHETAFGVWSALLYCPRCDAAWHPALGVLGPSVAVPGAVHAAATALLQGLPAPPPATWSA
jgi:hypothetical protein